MITLVSKSHSKNMTFLLLYFGPVALCILNKLLEFEFEILWGLHENKNATSDEKMAKRKVDFYAS